MILQLFFSGPCSLKTGITPRRVSFCIGIIEFMYFQFLNVLLLYNPRIIPAFRSPPFRFSWLSDRPTVYFSPLQCHICEFTYLAALVPHLHIIIPLIIDNHSQYNCSLSESCINSTKHKKQLYKVVFTKLIILALIVSLHLVHGLFIKQAENSHYD